MSATGLKVLFGGAVITTGYPFGNDELLKTLYDTLDKCGVKSIDTARIYGDSEEWLGKSGGPERFVIDTKTPGGLAPGQCTGATIFQHAKDSLDKLKTKKVDIYYIHAADASLDLADMLSGINDAHKAGYFERFGLSNYTPLDVQRVYDICKDKGYPLPTVYQGSYSPVGRKPEQELLPLLRKLNISYYVYSPLAGGFLTKTKEQIVEGNASRFSKDSPVSKIYNNLFNRPAYLESLEKWQKAAEAAGCTRAELGYRWVAYDSALDPKHGDGIIIGATSLEQLSETLEWLKKGPVGPAASALVDEVWKTVEHEAQLDNFNE